MNYSVRVSTRGRITVPKALRLAIGLTRGARYSWRMKDNGIVLRVLRRGKKE